MPDRFTTDRRVERAINRPACYGVYTSTWWRKLRLIVLARQPVCRACQRAAATEVDHIVPRRAGGPDDISNLQGLCHHCHAVKSSREAGHVMAAAVGAPPTVCRPGIRGGGPET